MIGVIAASHNDRTVDAPFMVLCRFSPFEGRQSFLRPGKIGCGNISWRPDEEILDNDIGEIFIRVEQLFILLRDGSGFGPAGFSLSQSVSSMVPRFGRSAITRSPRLSGSGTRARNGRLDTAHAVPQELAHAKLALDDPLASGTMFRSAMPSAASAPRPGRSAPWSTGSPAGRCSPAFSGCRARRVR